MGVALFDQPYHLRHNIPLTMQSMLSMRKMQEVQPKLHLRERHKNDPQKLNTEMMEILPSRKINPFGGCLPFLIQMPFFMPCIKYCGAPNIFRDRFFVDQRLVTAGQVNNSAFLFAFLGQ